ncbi:hypothetical protein NCER_102363 [Vairimorpha ceranae BRL01]|uniref:Uncharacterized protein n=1 Tax=Vairimorpha ceranae (strain BRL01) TaxID=578460 RepID=C4VBW7_VAIC1|nr:hypothetical protein NCER_102363 [Vairimorpha ceranae BRL01]
MSEFNYSNIIDYKMMNSLVTSSRETNNLTIVKEYDISYELTKTTRGKKFLFYDSGIHDENRIVVFTTDENILHLINCKIMICDSTFKSAFKNFEQIFILQCNVRNKNLPLLYCFMKNKK